MYRCYLISVLMSTALPACPSCQSEDVVKNGRTRHDKQNYKCRDCGRQFVENPQWRVICEETKSIIDRLLLEKLPLAGIARALQISELWVQQYVNQKYKRVEQEVQVRPKRKRRLTEEAGVQGCRGAGGQELSLPSGFVAPGFIHGKETMSCAEDARARHKTELFEAPGFIHEVLPPAPLPLLHRSGTEAQALWDSLPAVYRQCAVIGERFLGVLSGGTAEPTTSCSWQGNWFNELY